MVRIALIYGAIAGGIVIGAMILGFQLTDGEGAATSLWFGYLLMIVALSMIFFGVKRYRDRDLGGVIKFFPAFLLGLAIGGVAGIVYVGVWEAYLAATDYSYIEKYAAGIIEKKQAEGLAGAALQAQVEQMNELVKSYGNPLFRLPMTFLEIFPVAVVIALASAALLRNPKLLPARA